MDQKERRRVGGEGGSNTHSVGHYKKKKSSTGEGAAVKTRCTLQCRILNTRPSDFSAPPLPLDWQRKMKGNKEGAKGSNSTAVLDGEHRFPVKS